ncbi:MAG TPA: 3-deoxy-manno-octulosonate cytidylyltransferase [Rubrivivax sp.]|nr:3-deoxy-manno-octulosonate cytidylyltransferase [Rubrivivax sp.]
MSFTVLIPARLASTRLPDKPLADIAGKPMVVRVAERAALSGAARVVVAADDLRIVHACGEHGVQAVLTRTSHLSGSDRLGEACGHLGLDGDELVVNVQGDEPLIAPMLVRRCAELLLEQPDCLVSTAAHPITEHADYTNPNVVKVVLDRAGRALYFSRAPIPVWRDGAGALPDRPPALRHLGLYGYHASLLRRWSAMPAAPLEQLEALEQLRLLWHGERIAVHVANEGPGPGVDTPADLARVRALFDAPDGPAREP